MKMNKRCGYGKCLLSAHAIVSVVVVLMISSTSSTSPSSSTSPRRQYPAWTLSDMSTFRRDASVPPTVNYKVLFRLHFTFISFFFSALYFMRSVGHHLDCLHLHSFMVNASLETMCSWRYETNMLQLYAWLSNVRFSPSFFAEQTACLHKVDY